MSNASAAHGHLHVRANSALGEPHIKTLDWPCQANLSGHISRTCTPQAQQAIHAGLLNTSEVFARKGDPSCACHAERRPKLCWPTLVAARLLCCPVWGCPQVPHQLHKSDVALLLHIHGRQVPGDGSARNSTAWCAHSALALPSPCPCIQALHQVLGWTAHVSHPPACPHPVCHQPPSCLPITCAAIILPANLLHAHNLRGI